MLAERFAAMSSSTTKEPGHFCYRAHRDPAGLPLNEEEEEGLQPPELPEVPAYKK